MRQEGDGLKIETMRVLEITDEDLKGLERNDNPIRACKRMAAEADGAVIPTTVFCPIRYGRMDLRPAWRVRAAVIFIHRTPGLVRLTDC